MERNKQSELAVLWFDVHWARLFSELGTQMHFWESFAVHLRWFDFARIEMDGWA